MIHSFSDFEAALPAERIQRRGPQSFLLQAYSETDREAFRLDCGWENTADHPETLQLQIDWPSIPFSELRDCFYWKSELDADWSPIFGQTSPGKSFLSWQLPPGRGILSLHPYYGCCDLEHYLATLPAEQVDVQTFGHSAHHRPLRVLSLGQTGAPVILITARNHANETSGNYCVEGMLNWLLSSAPLARYSLEHFHFMLVPITNPDGVAEGMARYTAPNGADLNRTPEWQQKNCPDFEGDPVLTACYELFQGLKPAIFLNLHSYLFKFKDQIMAPDEDFLQRFTTFMPDQTEAGKTWYRSITDQRDFPTGWCAQRFGTMPILLEIPWFMRNAKNMRQTGAKIIQALLLAQSLEGPSVWGKL